MGFPAVSHSAFYLADAQAYWMHQGITVKIQMTLYWSGNSGAQQGEMPEGYKDQALFKVFALAQQGSEVWSDCREKMADACAGSCDLES